MKDWQWYQDNWESKHTENKEHTLKWFRHLMAKYGTGYLDQKFDSILEIGSGMSGGYLDLITADDKYSIDPLHGQFKEKAEEMGFVSDSMDLVIISNALDHCEDMQRVADQITRVLKPGGVLFLFSFLNHPTPHPYTFKNAEEILKLFPNLKIEKNFYSKGELGRDEFTILFLRK